MLSWFTWHYYVGFRGVFISNCIIIFPIQWILIVVLQYCYKHSMYKRKLYQQGLFIYLVVRLTLRLFSWFFRAHSHCMFGEQRFPIAECVKCMSKTSSVYLPPTIMQHTCVSFCNKIYLLLLFESFWIIICSIYIDTCKRFK